jgi:hypothetical protein
VFDTFAGLVTGDPLSEAASARMFFDLLAEHAPAAAPHRWGISEPLDQLWTAGMPDERRWPGDWMVIWRPEPSGAAEGKVSPPPPAGAANRVPRATASIAADRTQVDPAALVAFVRAAAVPLRAEYGYVHLASEPDAVTETPRSYGAVTRDDDGDLSLSVTAYALVEDGIPELLWGTVLGPGYVAMAGGARAVESAPAAAVERLGPDTYWLQITAAPTDPLADWPAFDAARQKVKRHLGEDLFWAPGRATRRPEWT